MLSKAPHGRDSGRPHRALIPDGASPQDQPPSAAYREFAAAQLARHESFSNSCFPARALALDDSLILHTLATLGSTRSTLIMAPVAIETPSQATAAAAAVAPHLLKANKPHAPEFKQSVAGLSENPLQRTYRGNKEGTIHLEGIPKISDPYEKREWVKVSLGRYLAIASSESRPPRAVETRMVIFAAGTDERPTRRAATTRRGVSVLGQARLRRRPLGAHHRTRLGDA